MNSKFSDNSQVGVVSTFDELISNRLNEEELCDYINADSLAFLNLESSAFRFLYNDSMLSSSLYTGMTIDKSVDNTSLSCIKPSSKSTFIKLLVEKYDMYY